MSNDVFIPVSYPQLGRERVAPRAEAVAAGLAEGLRRAALGQRAAEEAARSERQAARRADEERVTAAVTALHTAIARLDARLAPVLSEADATLAAAALALAEAVLGREVREGHTNAEDALRRVFQAVPSGRVVTVHLNPADLATLRAVGHLDEEASGSASADESARRHPASDGGVRYVADPSLAPGDATADLQQGWLDARIGSALDRAREVLGVDL
jgi:flagellar assembly protein FliH